MIVLTEKQQKYIAIALMTDRQIEQYITICNYAENGMTIDDAITKVEDELSD